MAKKDKLGKKIKGGKKVKVKEAKVFKTAKKAKVDKKSAGKSAGGKKGGKGGGVPKGMHTVTAQLVFDDAARAIALYREAFGAKELSRMTSPDGKAILHAEISIGGSVIFLSDASPLGQCVAASAAHKPTFAVQLYVKDCDRWIDRAVAAGCRAVMPAADMFWGDRMGMVVDPFHQVWSIGTRVRDLSPKQMKKAQAEFMRAMAASAAGPADARAAGRSDDANITISGGGSAGYGPGDEGSPSPVAAAGPPPAAAT